MKKVFLILSTILLFGTMAGCSVRSASGDDGMSEPAGDKGQTTNVADKETGGETSDPEMASAGELTSAEGTVNFPASELEEKLNQFPATIDFNFHFISNHETLIQSDKMYLFDLSSNEVTAEMEKPDAWKYGIDVYPLKDGYAVIADSADNGLECTWLDKELRVQNTLNICRTTGLEPIFTQNVSVSSDGNLLAIADTGIWLFDVQTGEKKELLTCENPDTLCGLDKIAFTEHDKQIAFTGQRISQNTNKGETVYGSINIDGSDLFTEAGKDLSKLAAYDSNILFWQEVEDGDASGEACVYLPASHSTSQFPLVEKAESVRLWGSQEGGYFGSSVKNKDGFTVRLYQTVDGNQVYESTYSYDPLQYRNPHIYIYDTAKIMLLQFDTYEDTQNYKIKVISFSENR